MTRIKNGIWDEVELESGFFITERDTDIICDWLKSYSDALEAAWRSKGSEGEERKAKHTKVRSFILAVERKRGGTL